MTKAIVALCKALAEVLDHHYASFDRETSDLMRALAEYVRKNQ